MTATLDERIETEEGLIEFLQVKDRFDLIPWINQFNAHLGEMHGLLKTVEDAIVVADEVKDPRYSAFFRSIKELSQEDRVISEARPSVAEVSKPTEYATPLPYRTTARERTVRENEMILRIVGIPYDKTDQALFVTRAERKIEVLQRFFRIIYHLKLTNNTDVLKNAKSFVEEHGPDTLRELLCKQPSTVRDYLRVHKKTLQAFCPGSSANKTQVSLEKRAKFLESIGIDLKYVQQISHGRYIAMLQFFYKIILDEQIPAEKIPARTREFVSTHDADDIIELLKCKYLRDAKEYLAGKRTEIRMKYGLTVSDLLGLDARNEDENLARTHAFFAILFDEDIGFKAIPRETRNFIGCFGAEDIKETISRFSNLKETEDYLRENRPALLQKYLSLNAADTGSKVCSADNVHQLQTV